MNDRRELLVSKLYFMAYNTTDMKSRGIFILTTIALISLSARSFAQEAANCICGRWVSADNTLIVDICKQDNDFRARIVWFDAGSEQKMQQWRDDKNPDPKLRSRKIIGMNILSNLQYRPATKSYENGQVYDAMNGHSWNASVTINKQGKMNVRGYWHFKFLGKTMSFTRMEDEARLNKTAPRPMPQRSSESI